jgi:uncharacterized protein YndB with AHSA1/START domain
MKNLPFVRRSLWALAGVGLMLSFQPTAIAEVKAMAPDYFRLECRAVFPESAKDAWARLVRIERWWSPAHTYSGDASNLSLKPVAGGTWREVWPGGQVEHGRVVAAMPPQLLRLDAPLGPLQEMGVSATLTIQLAPQESGGTLATYDYRVSGVASQQLDRIASAVDGVLCEQAMRFAAAG